MKITIPVKPVPKARPRVVRKGNRTMAFTPSRTVQAEMEIRSFLLSQKLEKFEQGVPLSLDATFYVERPKSRKKAAYPATRPDLSSFLALLLDAMTGYLYYDDAQVVDIRTRKVYGEPPRIELTLEP
jgi:Holliday junction resolvase RusA-like endonuclease